MPAIDPAVEITDATLRDVSFVTANLRAEDHRELFATVAHGSPQRLAREVAYGCKPLWVVKRNGQPAVILLARELHPGVGLVGMFATDDWPNVALQTTLFARDHMLPTFDDMGWNRVEARSIEGHDEAHAWLGVLGAKPEFAMPDYGIDRETFYLFAWRRSDFDRAGVSSRDGAKAINAVRRLKCA